MKIELNVPFAEKDQARRLGAQWNGARKTWFVEDVENLWPFLKWMPKHLKRQTGTAPAKKTEEKKSRH